MNILLVGYDTPGALEGYCTSALKRLGCPVQLFDLATEYARHRRLATVPVVGAIEKRRLLKRTNDRLLTTIRASHPDVVLAFKGMEVLPDTLEMIRQMNNRPLLINWNPDNPFDSAPSNSSPDLLNGISLYDVYFIWDRDLFGPLREVGARQVEYLPFGYDPAAHFPVELAPAERDQLASDVCFVGGYTRQRADLLAQLMHHRVGIWGPNWEHLPTGHPVENALRGGFTHGVRMSRVFSAAGVVMNFVRPQNKQAHNMRTFETPATGALMVSTRTRDQLRWLPEDEAAAYFESPRKMVETVDAYLSEDERRRQVAAEGTRQIMAGKHTYDDRMRQVVATIEAL